MKSRTRAHLAILLVTLIFGLNYSISKSILSLSLNPAQLVFLRLLGGFLMFWTFQRFFPRETVEKRDLWKMAVCALLGFALNQTLFYEGLNLTSPVDASLIHVLNPVLVTIAAHFMLREKVTGWKIIGIAFGATGALILILYGRKTSFDGHHASGNILVFLNMVSYAFYLVLIKPVTLRYHPATILKWVSLFGFIAVLPYNFRDAIQINFSSIGIKGFLGLAYIIIINTFLAYMLINYALKHLTTGSVSYYNYLQPLIAAIMTLSVGQDILSWPKILAGGLIFTGVYIVNKSAMRT